VRGLKSDERNLIGNKRILIVEDDLGLAEILCMMLSEYDVTLATDGETAVKAYLKLRPALVLMDIVMPNMRGLEATKKIIEIDPNAKIIGVTAFGRRWGKELLEAGALEIINKPFRKRDLIEIIDRYLEVE
jgi:two-component system response regulator/two-component system chemotaxis response regulator CheY